MLIKDLEDFPANKTGGSDNCQFHGCKFWTKVREKSVKYGGNEAAEHRINFLLTMILPFENFPIKQKTL
jgi:hypothetical protein